MEKKSEEKEVVQTGLLSIVSTPIGHIDDITLRALRTLKKADAVVCEEFKPAATLLMKLGIDKELHELNEHTSPEDQAEIVMMLREGKHLALISDCGTPIIADPGSGILDAAIQHGVTVEALPGASSPMTALVLSNFSTEKFVYAGFLSRQPEVRIKEVELWMNQPYTTVFLETPYRIKPFLEAFAAIAPDRTAFLGCNLTMPTESLHRGTLKELCEKFAEKKFKGEFVLVVDANTAATGIVVPRVQSEGGGEDRDRGFSDRRPRSFNRDRASRPPRRDFGGDRRPQRENWKERTPGGSGDDRRGGDGGFRRDDRRGGDGGFRRDDRRGGDGGFRRDDRRGGGDRRDDRRSGGGDRRPRRDDRRDDRRGGDGGFRRDDRRGGDGGFRRDDRRGGGDRRPRRDDRRDDRRGGGGGFGRDDRRGGGDRRPRRDDRRDDRRGGGGFGRDDRRGGGDRRPRRDDRRDDRRGGGGFGRDDRRGGGDRRPQRDDRRDDRREGGDNKQSNE